MEAILKSLAFTQSKDMRTGVLLTAHCGVTWMSSTRLCARVVFSKARAVEKYNRLLISIIALHA
jgi:hypothetical protein